ncbi:hypothetical protein, partial [Sinorhizobium meliloti]
LGFRRRGRLVGSVVISEFCHGRRRAILSASGLIAANVKSSQLTNWSRYVRAGIDQTLVLAGRVAEWPLAFAP